MAVKFEDFRSNRDWLNACQIVWVPLDRLSGGDYSMILGRTSTAVVFKPYVQDSSVVINVELLESALLRSESMNAGMD